MNLRRLATAVCSLLGFFVLSYSAQAATVGIVTATILDPSGNIIEGIPAYLYDASGSYADYTTSNASGNISFFSKEEGSYTISLLPSQAYDCSGCALFEKQEVDITVSTASAPYDEAFSTTIQNLGNISLVQASRYVTVNISDQDGSPVAGMSVSAWGGAASESWASTTTNSSGSSSFAWDQDTLSISAWDQSGSYSSGNANDVAVAATGETLVAMDVLKTDASIAATLKKDGAAYTLDTTEFASLFCMDSTYTNYFSGSISGGESSGTVGVVAGTYTCNVWVQGYGAQMSSNSITVSTNGTASVDVNLLAYDSTIVFKYVDTAGNTLSIDNISAYANSVSDSAGGEFFGDFVYGQGSDEVSLSVLGGFTYQVGANFSADSEGIGEFEGKSIQSGVYTAASGKHYIQNYEMTEVTPTAGAVSTVTQVLKEADATLSVTVLKANGKPDSGAWVNGMEEMDIEKEETFEAWGSFIGGSTDSDGVVTLYAESGKEYQVSAWLSTMFDGKTLPPPFQYIALKPGETKSITLQAKEADHTLNITAQTESSAAISSTAVGNFDYTYCYGYTDNGTENFTDLSSGTGSLAVTSQDSWYVGCMAYTDDTFYRSNDTKVKTGKSDGSTDVSLTLTEFSNYYEETSYQGSATATETFTLPDGESSLIIPANSVAESGTYTLTVGTATDYSVKDSDYPVDVFEFGLLDSNGTDLTGTEFASSLTLNLAYDEDRLDELGIDPATVTGGHYSDTGWGAPQSAETDTDSNTVKIALNEFSSYGILGDRGLSSNTTPAKARKLKTKQITDSTARLSWLKPTGSTVTKYKAQLRVCKNETAKKCKKAKHYVKSAKWDKYNKIKKQADRKRKIKDLSKLQADQYYQWRVRACNASDCGDWTSWKRFVTASSL